MKAAILKNWNELEMAEIEKPEACCCEAVIKVRYGGVCGSDITVFSGLHPTAKAPVVLCHEILGTIDELPKNYKGKLKAGDRVLIDPVVSCQECPTCKSGLGNVCGSLKLLGIHINGGFAQYTKAAPDQLVKVSDNLPDNVAALGEPFAVAYHVCKRAGVAKKNKVLVTGAGTIGIVVALAAKELGAERVIVSEINKSRIELAKSLGLETVNPMEIDLPAFAKEASNSVGFDIVIDASGAKQSILQLPDLCRPGGTLMSLSLSSQPYEFIIGKVSFKEQTLVGSRLYSHDDFIGGVEMMKSLFKSCDLSQIVTDTMDLDELPEALNMMKTGKNVGKILIKCN